MCYFVVVVSSFVFLIFLEKGRFFRGLLSLASELSEFIPLFFFIILPIYELSII